MGKLIKCLAKGCWKAACGDSLYCKEHEDRGSVGRWIDRAVDFLTGADGEKS